MTDRKAVLITGAGGGIGSATARRFASEGWRVLLTDADGETLARVARDLRDTSCCVADLRTRSACCRVVAEMIERAGRIDALVNAAGVWREGPAEACSEEDFDLVIDVNLKAAYFMCAAAIPHLKKSEGLIVNLSSDAGIQGNTGAAAYCASKGGVSILTKALALELAPYGVRVNAVCPGDVDSPMLAFQAKRYGGGDPQGYLSGLLAKYPQGPARARFIQPGEIAALVYYLASPESVAMTGANISIDFGYSAGK